MSDEESDNVIPFRHGMIAIAEQLRRMYDGFVREKLPDDIVSLMKRFEELTKEKR